MNRWSAQEQEIFDKYYPIEGAAVADRLPGRSKKAISQRAMTQGITMTPEARKARRTGRPRKSVAVTTDEVQTTDVATPEEKKKRLAYGPGGATYEYGTTAGTKPGLQKVPDSATNLPWVSYPRDADTARAVAAACEYMARSSDAVKKVGPEAQRFFESQAAYLRAIAQRMEASAAA